MASIYYTLQTKPDNKGEYEISLSVYINKANRYQVGSMISIGKKHWSNKNRDISLPNIPGHLLNELTEKQNVLHDLDKALINEIKITGDKSLVTRQWIEEFIRRFHKNRKKQKDEIDPDNKIEVKKPLIEEMNNYLAVIGFSESRKKHFKTLIRILQRFELYQKAKGKRNYKLYPDELSHEDLNNIQFFLGNEDEAFEQYPWIYDQVPLMARDSIKTTRPRKTLPNNKRNIPKKRAVNYVCDLMIRFRTFVIWANKAKIMNNNPFETFTIREPVYGDPIYITVSERQKLYYTDMSQNRQLETQRDIFILQCYIGCRVGDYFEMTYDNIVDDAIEYIANKTNLENPKTVRVPLSETAKDIIRKYHDPQRKTLMPFISELHYNEYIKEAFEAAGITRMVTVLNPLTHKGERVPINTIASSHMARRTFIGNIFKKVKDQNMVSTLSGHKEGSRAFARYRVIDDDMKKEMIAHLD